MRKYYYLTGLEGSPYELSLEEALHLGATEQISTYVFVELSKAAFRVNPDNGVNYRDRLDLKGNFIKAHGPEIRDLERDPFSSTFITHGYLDHRFNKCSSGFGDCHQEPVFVEIGRRAEGLSIIAADLLFFTDDLEHLVSTGLIKHRGDDTSTSASSQPGNALEALPHKFQQLYAAIAGGELPDLEAAINAWHLHWHERPDRGERDTYPKNPNIQAWLENRGVSKNKAENIPPLIRPKWG